MKRKKCRVENVPGSVHFFFCCAKDEILSLPVHKKLKFSFNCLIIKCDYILITIPGSVGKWTRFFVRCEHQIPQITSLFIAA